MQTDELLLNLAHMIQVVESKRNVVDLDRLDKLILVHKALVKCFDGKKVDVTYELFKPTQSTGCIRLTGREIVFDNMDILLSCTIIADNFDVCCKVDGSVELEFTFNGLKKMG